MKIFKLIKAFIVFARKAKNEKDDEPIFGRDPGIYHVEDPLEKEIARKMGTKVLHVSTYFPEEGGTFTRIEGEKEPFPGFPQKDVVMNLATLKRMIPAALDAYYPFLSPHLLSPEKYCKCVREVYRLFNILIEREVKPKHIERWKKVRDIVCIVLEFDNAYRFRAQDIIAEAKIDEMKLGKGDQYWAGKTPTYKWGFNQNNSNL